LYVFLLYPGTETYSDLLLVEENDTLHPHKISLWI